jgi:hypothetical protein
MRWLRERIARVILFRLKFRMRDVSPLRGLTADGWVALADQGVQIPDSLCWRRFEASPNPLQRLRLSLAKRIAPK